MAMHVNAICPDCEEHVIIRGGKVTCECTRCRNCRNQPGDCACDPDEFTPDEDEAFWDWRESNEIERDFENKWTHHEQDPLHDDDW